VPKNAEALLNHGPQSNRS